MRNPSRTFAVFTAPLLVAFAAGCAGSEPAPATLDAPSPGAPASEGGPAEVPPGVSGTPSDADLVESAGVFVVPGARSDGAGTRLDPLGSIAAAIKLARETRRRVFVCEGTYSERLEITAGDDLLGGLSCGDVWRTGGKRAVVKAPASPAMVARNVTRRARVQGFEIVAPDGAGPSGSSIALLADHAPSLLVADARLVAGRGADGVDGEAPEQATLTGGDGAAGRDEYDPARHGPDYVALVRSSPFPASPTDAPVGTCSAGPQPEAGGAGAGGQLWVSEWSGQQLRYVFNPVGAAPAPRQVRASASGAPGVAGTSATVGGTFSAQGYAAQHGTPGTDGLAGRGGSGGAGSYQPVVTPTYDGLRWAATGGSGGTGGCAGLAGTAGTGGGASVGALLVASPGMAFVDVAIVASDGGVGGRGTFGSAPTPGGAAGFTPHVAYAATAGGAGGVAGPSGAGAGGPSYAIVHVTGQPRLERGSRVAGRGGAGAPAEVHVGLDGVTRTIAASKAGGAGPILGL